ncbi:histidine phosphatase family protein [Salinigranum marinum]|uniref:histidine phosphatase family protein n=1 Tax=Salinigranum marinum TaxID=1515595 RepID=UPI002989A82F|nr:histidine phosphatase family protein [Salinigranum marinum]
MTRVLWLVRHGERRDEADPGWVDQADRPHDPPLTDHGRWQAERVADRLGGREIGAVYSSPFLRAAETAHIVAQRLDCPLFVDHGLSEHLNADWFDVAPSIMAPRTLAERFDTVDTSHASVLRPNYPESDDEAADRTVRAVRRLAASAPDSVLFVGHGLTVASVVSGFTGRTDVDTPPCGITRLTAYPWGWDVDLLADTSHLSDDDTAGEDE